MNKKLCCLLAVPFLLAGCGGSGNPNFDKLYDFLKTQPDNRSRGNESSTVLFCGVQVLSTWKEVALTYHENVKGDMETSFTFYWNPGKGGLTTLSDCKFQIGSSNVQLSITKVIPFEIMYQNKSSLSFTKAEFDDYFKYDNEYTSFDSKMLESINKGLGLIDSHTKTIGYPLY